MAMSLPKINIPNKVMYSWLASGLVGGIALYLYVWVIYRNASNDGRLSGYGFWTGLILCAVIGPIVSVILLKIYARRAWPSVLALAVLGTLLFYVIAALVLGGFVLFILLIFRLAG